MFKKAERLNLERTTDQISKNLVHKVLGRRGERIFRQVELRDNEKVNEEGRVVFLEQGLGREGEGRYQRRGEKRGNRSPGTSPPARRVFGGRRGEAGEGS